MAEHNEDQVRSTVREHYAKVAETNGACGCAPGCCAPGATSSGASLSLGYNAEDLSSVPEGADMGLGCGNPRAIAALQPGETILDLGSGGGFDCFLAARQVGTKGRVIGVDMTPEMIKKARENAARIDARNVEFRLGEIERLPVADASVDAILSNCVINLSPNKRDVFREAFRVLRPGGRLAISDVVALSSIPQELRSRVAALSGCIALAAQVDELERTLLELGFEEVQVTPHLESREFIKDWLPGSGAENFVASATIEAKKPSSTEACCAPSCCQKGGTA